MALCTALLMIMSGCSKQTEVGFGESFTAEGVIVSNERSFPSYCLKLDKKISITLLDEEYSEEFDCDTLYFYDEPYLNGNYNYSQLEDKKCTVTAELENYRGGGDLFLLNPTITPTGNETEVDNSIISAENEELMKSRANGSWARQISTWDSQNLVIRSDGYFVMTYNSYGEIKEWIDGKYEVVSDDGQYQKFCFYDSRADHDLWYATLYQTTSYNENGFPQYKLEYISDDGEVMYYTGVKFLD